MCTVYVYVYCVPMRKLNFCSICRIQFYLLDFWSCYNDQSEEWKLILRPTLIYFNIVLANVGYTLQCENLPICTPPSQKNCTPPPLQQSPYTDCSKRMFIEELNNILTQPYFLFLFLPHNVRGTKAIFRTPSLGWYLNRLNFVKSIESHAPMHQATPFFIDIFVGKSVERLFTFYMGQIPHNSARISRIWSYLTPSICH